MSLIPITALDFSLVPIGGGISYGELPPVVATSETKSPDITPDIFASINQIATQISGIYNKGMDAYGAITGRDTANRKIAQEIVQPVAPPIIIQSTRGFYDIYNENRMSVLLVGGGIVLLTITILLKKLR